MPIATTAFIDALLRALPECITTDEEAMQTLSVISSVIAGGIRNRDAVFLEGVGEWRSEAGRGQRRVVFTPDRPLLEGDSEEPPTLSRRS